MSTSGVNEINHDYMDKLTIKVNKWTGGSGYKYTDININDYKYSVSIVETNATNDFALVKGDMWTEIRYTTYKQALQAVSKIIIEYLRGQT